MYRIHGNILKSNQSKYEVFHKCNVEEGKMSFYNIQPN
jgi:hypothetical protein